MTDKKERNHYVNFILDGQSEFSLKIPDAIVDGIYEAETVQLSIDVEEIDRHCVLGKSDKLRVLT